MSTSLSDLVARYLVSCEARGLSNKSIGNYRHHLTRYIEHAEESHPEPWYSVGVIESYIAGRRRAGLALSTVAHDYNVLKAFFAWCIKRDGVDIATNPVLAIAKPKVPRKRQRTATPAEVATLLDSIGHKTWITLRDRLIVHLLFYGGVRIGEAVSLKINYIILEERIIVIDETGKGRQFRHVPLFTETAKAYVEYMLSRPPVECDWLLIPSSKGGRPLAKQIHTFSVRQRLKEHCERAGIRYLNPHSFRHGFAVHLLNDKHADMSLIQAVLGHKSIATTAHVYAAWSDEGIKSAYMRLMEDD